MKTARFVLKIVAGSLGLAASVCAVIGFWDVIMDGFDKLGELFDRD